MSGFSEHLIAVAPRHGWISAYPCACGKIKQIVTQDGGVWCLCAKTLCSRPTLGFLRQLDLDKQRYLGHPMTRQGGPQ